MPGMEEYYKAGGERSRLASGWGALEFARTQELILRHLPPAPAVVLDVGGAAGAYSGWLASRGYTPHLCDRFLAHAVQARGAGVQSAAAADARELPYAAACVDAVLLLGPLYHLTERACRIEALAEAWRVLRAGGVLFAAAISRYASLFDGLARGLIDDAAFRAILERDLAEGQHRNDSANPEYFTTAFFHLPKELRGEIAEAGFTAGHVYAVEGPVWLANGFEKRWADAEERRRLLDIARRVERDSTVIGASPHLLAVARKAA